MFCFVGVTGFYHRFIPGFAETVTPLTDLLKQDWHFHWSKHESTAFCKLKDDFVKVVTVTHFNLPFLLHVDASGIAIGANLSQVEPGTGVICLLSCLSKKLSPAEKNQHMNGNF